MNKEGKGLTSYGINNLQINPHQEILNFITYNIVLLFGILILSFLYTSFSNGGRLFIILTFILLILCILSYIFTWIHDKLTKEKIRDFINSKRIELSWYYNESEWARIKRKEWKKEKRHIFVSFISLSVLFAIIGFISDIISVSILDKNYFFFKSLRYGVFFGLCIGLTASISTYLTAKKQKKNNLGRFVAIGDNELFCHGDYFKSSRKRWFSNGRITKSNPAKLVFSISSPISDFVGDIHEKWAIIIPYKKIPTVKKFLKEKNELSPSISKKRYQNVIKQLDPYKAG